MVPARDFPMSGYAELAAISNFSFLRGASHPDEMVAQAKALGLEAIAVGDWNTLAGLVRGHAQGKDLDFKFIPACRLVLRCGFQAVCLPTDRAAYGRLSRLLTLGKRRTEKGACDLSVEDVIAWRDGQIFIALPPYEWTTDFERTLRALAAACPQTTYLGAARTFRAGEHRRLAELHGKSLALKTPMVAVGDAYYHAPERRPLQDILTCTREKTRINEAGFRLEANAERHLKPPGEMVRLFQGYEEAVARSVEIARACAFSLDQLTYDYPKELIAPYETAQAR
ncbi:MAG: PHP domain-containing protein, partial [Pseudomonadota bacterium]